MPSLNELLTPRRTEPSRYLLEIPDQWQQGRGAFGGYVIGSLVRTLELELEGQARGLRSLSAVICGPVMVGPAELRTEVLRAGNAVTSVAIRLEQEGGTQAFGLGVLGKARTSELDRAPSDAPVLPPWESLEPLPDAPLKYRAYCRSVREGFLVEHRELWGIDGRLVALNQQTFVVIK